MIDEIDGDAFIATIPMDGILGAWFKPTDTDYPDIQTAVLSILAQTERNLFTIALSGHENQQAGTGGGLVTYGALDNVSCAKDWSFVPAREDGFGYWEITVDGISFDSTANTSKGWVVMDTGDPRMNIPSEVLSAIIAAGKAEQEPDTGSYIVDCDADLPDLVLTIAGKEYAIPSKEYILDIKYKPGKCVLNVDDDIDTGFMIGDPFYRTFCTAYDYDKKKVGFAKTLI